MTKQGLIEILVGATNLATASGMDTTAQVWSLLVTSLAIVDREMPLGTPREEWISVCTHVYDSVRGALAEGPAA